MSRFSLSSLSWFALLLALLLWAGSVLFALHLSAMETTLATRTTSLKQESVKQETALKIRALVRETKEERIALEELTSADADTILDGIEEVGRDAGVALEIGQASSGGDTDSLHTTSLLITGGGTFSKVMHVAALLESFRIPSVIDELHFEKIESSDPKIEPWQVVVHMRFLTTGETL